MSRKATKNPPADDWFRLVFNAVGDAIILCRAENGRILDANRRAGELWGYNLQEFRKLSPAKLGSGVSPYGEEDIRRLFKWGREGKAGDFEWHARAKDGNYFWIEGSITGTTIAGREILAICCRDITERKRVENELDLHRHHLMSVVERKSDGLDQATEVLRVEVLERVQAMEVLRETGLKYRTIIEQLNEGFALVDGQGKLTEWNAAMEHLSGLSKSRVLGTYFWDTMSQLCVPDDELGIGAGRAIMGHQLHEATRETLISGRTAPLNATLPALLYKPNGTRVACRMTVFPVGMDSGWFAALVVTQR